MRAIHPFPARMAPQIAIDSLRTLKKGARILDPMCGSGTVVRAAIDHHHEATGLDLDPLSKMIATTWCSQFEKFELVQLLKSINEARYDDETYLELIECNETRFFINRWFAEEQLKPLAHIALQISKINSEKEKSLFSVALSRIIVTKTRGASLAWDISHSRPHLKKTYNDFDVLSEFSRSAMRLIEYVTSKAPQRDADVRLMDCRQFSEKNEYDAVITSPPYLNAIDYLRGHKFSLVWLGHKIPLLRDTRASLIGTERRSNIKDDIVCELAQIERYRDKVRRRNIDIIEKYAVDCYDMMASIAGCLKSGGKLVLVVGNSNKDATEIRHDSMFEAMAKHFNLALEGKVSRPIEIKHRYLPYRTQSAPLRGRMKEEILLQFCKS